MEHVRRIENSQQQVYEKQSYPVYRQLSRFFESELYKEHVLNRFDLFLLLDFDGVIYERTHESEFERLRALKILATHAEQIDIICSRVRLPHISLRVFPFMSDTQAEDIARFFAGKKHIPVNVYTHLSKVFHPLPISMMERYREHAIQGKSVLYIGSSPIDIKQFGRIRSFVESTTEKHTLGELLYIHTDHAVL
jgi:hypothetical protein